MYSTCLFVNFSAVECTPLLAADNMQLSSDDHHFPDVINVTCDYGYELLVETNNGSIVVMELMQTECRYDQSWSRDLTTMWCQSKPMKAEKVELKWSVCHV